MNSKEKLERNKWKFSEKTGNIAGIDKCVNAMQRMVEWHANEYWRGDYCRTRRENRGNSDSWLVRFLHPLTLYACRMIIIAANAFQNRHPDEFCQNYDPEDMPCEYKQSVIFETEGYEVIVQKKPIRFK